MGTFCLLLFQKTRNCVYLCLVQCRVLLGTSTDHTVEDSAVIRTTSWCMYVYSIVAGAKFVCPWVSVYAQVCVCTCGYICRYCVVIFGYECIMCISSHWLIMCMRLWVCMQVAAMMATCTLVLVSPSRAATLINRGEDKVNIYGRELECDCYLKLYRAVVKSTKVTG